MDWIDVVIAAVTAVVAFVVWLLSTALLIWAERRVISKMQTRIGPNRLGPFGLMQVLADGAKLFFKEDMRPANADHRVYALAPAASAIVALTIFAVIPFGGSFDVTLGGEVRTISLQVWDPDIGMLWILAMSSLGVYGITLGGWASGSKYPLLGGVRSSAQMISYELAMSLGLASVFVWTGSLRVSDIVAAQSVPLGSVEVLGTTLQVPAWNILPQIVAFFLFFIAATAEAQRPPFDLPEGEGELVGGFVTEYSGAGFAMFFLGEFMQVISMSAITVTLFLGGPAGPTFGLAEGGNFAQIVAALLGFVYFAMKTMIFVFVFIWFRGTLPRMRYDRLMDLGWRVLLPFGLAWVLATATVVVAREELAQTDLRPIAFGIAAVFLVLFLAGPWLARLFGRGTAGTGGSGGGGGGTSRPSGPGDGPGGRALDEPAAAAREATEERVPDQVGVSS
jgi:NADH-quinone oxidoreductase subunit H